MKIRTLHLPILFQILSYSPVLADVRLPSIFSDNMVMQQGQPFRIWGWCDAGENIRIKGSWQFWGTKVRGDAEGRWQAQLKPPKAGGPYSLTVTGDTRIDIENILVGEVWLGSGQSNMDMGVGLINAAAGGAIAG